MLSNYDIVIVGGGIVGLTLASALTNSSLRIAVCEAKPFPQVAEDARLDARVSAINRCSENILTQLGAWQKIKSIHPYHEMLVWDAHSHGQIHFKSSDIFESNLGHIIENRRIQQALLDNLREKDNVDFLCPIDLHTIEMTASSSTLTFADGTTTNTQLIVGADGPNSWIRQQAKVPLKTWDYGHTAITCVVQTEFSHQQTARQCFLNSGTIALLPYLDPFHCALVWSSNDTERLNQLDDAAFAQELASSLQHRLGLMTVKSQRAHFPLRMRHATQYTQAGMALIGDAAHTIHPLAGQGMNLGILDAACLAEILLDLHHHQLPLGQPSLLRRYDQRRKTDNLFMISLMEVFKRGFSTSLLNPVRYLSLTLAQKCQPIKNYLMRRALGYSNDLPKIAQVSLTTNSAEFR